MYCTDKAHEVEPIISYNKADRHFNETRAVRSIRWQEDERPLRRRSQHHYRLKHGTWQGRNFYDVIHHSTPLIRYWAPLENGDEVVSLLHYDSYTSRNFLYAHGWGYQRFFQGPNGMQHCVRTSTYLNQARDWYGDRNTQFTTHLVFNADRRLRADESLMIPLFRKTSTGTDKEERKAMRERAEMMLNLLPLHHQQYINNAKCSERVGRPFGGYDDAMYGATDTLKHEYSTLKYHIKTQGPDLTQPNVAAVVPAWISFGQVVFNTLWSKRVYAACTSWDTFRQAKYLYANLMPTADDVVKAVQKELLVWVCPDSRGRKPYDLFAFEYPRSVWHSKSENHPDLHNMLQRRYRDLMGRLALSNV